MNTYFEDTIRILKNSLESLDSAAFDCLTHECVEALNRGNKIIASGLGKNVPVCDKFVGTMLSLGQDAGFMHTNSAVHGDLGMVHPGDVVIVLTKSGETVESIYLVNLLQKRGADIWLLTFAHDSTLVKKLRNHCLILDLEHEGDPWNIVPSNSTTVNLIVLQRLAMEIVKQRGVTLNEFRMNHPGGHIGETLKNV